MYALACKLNIDCDLLVTSRTEVKSIVWQSFERSIDSYLYHCTVLYCIVLYVSLLLRRIK